MNEATGKEMTPELKRWLDTWKSSFEQVLSQITGQTITMTVAPEPLPGLADDVWYAVTSSGAASGELSLRLPAASGSVLAQILLGEAQPTPVELTAEHKEALEELLRQVAGHAATALASAAGDVQLKLSAGSAPTAIAAATVCLVRTGQGVPPFSVDIQISVELVNALSQAPPVEVPAQPEAPVSTAAQSQAGPQRQSQSSAQPESSLRPSSPAAAAEPVPARYERLMDVELEVKLRFGAREMELRDVLALSPGSVVELDRNLQAPVDLLLDGRVIAQGDVVVVDGKYGLRITEVLDPSSAA